MLCQRCFNVEYCPILAMRFDICIIRHHSDLAGLFSTIQDLVNNDDVGLFMFGLQIKPASLSFHVDFNKARVLSGRNQLVPLYTLLMEKLVSDEFIKYKRDDLLLVFNKRQDDLLVAL